MEWLKGKGAQTNPDNPYAQFSYDFDAFEGIDELNGSPSQTIQRFYESPKKAINKITSPDLKMGFSINPYQGCEHGCVYCYARNSHQYWGFNSGQDFETKIIVKRNIVKLVEKEINDDKWKVHPLALSGNTDCYQPLERKEKLTRGILELMCTYQHPIGLITKNTLIERDMDILKDLAENKLVHVYFSISTMNESLRRKMEPRTASALKKLRTIEKLSTLNIPVGIMTAPIIPGLNHHEIPHIMENASAAGAVSAGYTVVRLNGSISEIFTDWLAKVFPERKSKVINQIKNLHGGNLNDSEWGRRIKGSGNYADVIHQLFEKSLNRYFSNRKMPAYNTGLFRKKGNLSLF
jgi:DNA repair photolyase